MFVRFRTKGQRLQVSLIATHRSDGRVRNEHVAGLGAALLPLSAANRAAFWQQLHPRLARLGNRLSGDDQAKILAAVHARITMVTGDELRALQIAAAAADARFWEMMEASNAELRDGNREVAATAEKRANVAGQAAEAAAARVAIAKDRVKRLEAGEAIASSIVEPDLRKLAHQAGMTDSDIRHSVIVHEIYQLGGEQEYLDATAPSRRREKTAARKVLRRLMVRQAAQ